MSSDLNCRCSQHIITYRKSIDKIRYHTDPSGTFIRYEAKAIGSGSEAAQSELQDKWHKVSVHLYL